jgi:membrane protease YdiL (CAAX protease family)
MPGTGPSAPSGAPSRRLLVSVAVAVLFAVLHAPHPLLVALAAAYGFALAWLSLRAPNVFAAACCQFLLGLQVYFVLGLSMRVGVFSGHPDVRFLRDIFSSVDIAIGGPR